MINLSMNILSNSILKKNKEIFQRNYMNLTNSCNSCHQSANHQYNVIVVPKKPPFSNQYFQIKN
ncbi:hypothetical protein J2Y38_004567 [Flavobacterium sp. 2755]|uniref:hypothetical protein n=1 Tax=Flavobacterium sp. 2755 TaxID=2817765 RepID=UPI00286794FA|nr:hypothetical protein [Flavobacterium sp. 2755]MDR6764334.1 hypothetical protein [Flavobacterium sp. 2755]